MTISDIITLLSLVIAIVAIISEKKRKHLLLKFSRLDFILLVVIFILINYFVFYNEFVAQGICLNFLYFDNFGLENPKYYAYVLSLASLLFILLKINYKHYPALKIESVTKFYRYQIENNEGSALLDLIEYYHLDDIINSIKSTRNKYVDTSDWLFEDLDQTTRKEKLLSMYHTVVKVLLPFSRTNRYQYARTVLHSIINDPALIALTANARPYFYAKLISEFKKDKRNAFPADLTNLFLDEIVRAKNFWLIKELNQSDNFDTGQPQRYFKDNKLIASFIQDVSVADVNKIWKPFGENAIKEIENEFNLGNQSKLLNTYRDDDILWEYCSYISIKFINILIIEAIVQRYTDSHFWLYYYSHITKKILKNLESFPPANIEVTETNYHHLIHKINDFMLHWLVLANDTESEGIFIDIIKCLGDQMHEIMMSGQFGEQRKKDLLENLLLTYCSFNETEKTDAIRTKLEGIFKKPSILTNGDHPYYSYLYEVWESFDKIPHRGYADNTDYAYFARLKENVIVPLGLNPDAY